MEMTGTDDAELLIGREACLQELHETLRNAKLVAIDAPAGMGKTAFALAYASRFAQEYMWIAYVNAASRASWLADSLELVTRLALPLAPEKQHLAGVSAALETWFATHEAYLLILDNVENAMPSSTARRGAGHTVVLTRRPGSDPALARMQLAALDTSAAALCLLRRAALLAGEAGLEAADAEQRALATRLAEEMGGLPLALSLAGAAARVDQGGLGDYQALYRSSARRLVELKAARDRLTDAIAITCSLQFLAVQKKQPLAAELLWFCAILAPVEIPRALFLLGASELTPALQELVHQPALLDEALDLLCAQGLLSMDATGEVLRMQTTAQETLCQALSETKRNGLVAQALRAFTHLVRAQAETPLPVRVRMAAHMLHLVNVSSERLIPHEGVADLFGQTATLLWELGLIQEAESLLRNALALWERLLGAGHETCGIARRNLGTLNALLKNYSEAELLFQSALLARSRALGPAHPEVILCLLDLAGVYAEQGKSNEARACYQEALKLGVSSPGEEHPLLVVAVHKLGQLALEAEQFVEAEVHLRRALSMYEANLGLEDSTTQMCLEQLAQACFQQQKFAQAEEVLQRLLEVRERAGGIEERATRALLQKIAEFALLQEAFTRSEAIYQRLYAWCKSAPGEEYQEEARGYLQFLVLLYLQQGREAEIDSLVQRLANVD